VIYNLIEKLVEDLEFGFLELCGLISYILKLLQLKNFFFLSGFSCLKSEFKTKFIFFNLSSS
jgi:hypothetical protein